MSKSNELTELFEKWIQHYQRMNIANAEERFSRDGMINEERYNQSSLKILFVLRDVNAEEPRANYEKEKNVKRHKEYEGFDLREVLRDGPKYQMWHAIARWSAGLLHGFPSFERIDNYKTMRDSLLSVAAINLKKTPGAKTACLDQVNAYANMDSYLIKKEIEIIDPDIIVGCGTFSHLIWLLDLPVDSDDPVSKVCVTEKFKVVPWRHPGRVNNKETYKQLKKKVIQYI
jgi:hypothetical protein